MIYYDGTHLVADSLAELHSFAEEVGIKRCWFQNHKKHPHYDCINKNKTLVLARKDVIIVDSRTIVKMFKGQDG